MDVNGLRWRRWITAALGASAFFAFAGIAAARLIGESGATTIDPQKNGTATAHCGSGSAAVAGGFSAPGFDPSTDTGPSILTFNSKRSGHGDWKASGHNFAHPAMPPAKADPPAGDLIAHAYCDRHDPSVTIREESGTVDPGGHLSLTPQCPRGREAVSGGNSTEPADARGFTAYANVSKRAGSDGWKVTFQNPDPDNAHSATAFVYCEKHGPTLVQAKASEDFAPTAQTATATAKCPKGTDIFSGGYTSTFTNTVGGVVFALPFASQRRTGDRWRVSAIEVLLSTAPASSSKGVAAGPSETAIAYCAK